MDEFTLIRDYFSTPDFVRKDVIIGVGDDAAITQVPQGQYLATTTDTLLEGVHFLRQASADAIAHKAIAVNLSDLAAMGAEPAWINLSLSLPEVDNQWLELFSQKVQELTKYFSIQLIGGDTVKGKLAVTITAQGFVPPESVLTRVGAKPGDWLFVTGTLGDAAAGLDCLQNKLKLTDKSAQEYLVARHSFPTPRVLAGTTLRRLANACIDVSDGLMQDLQHILKGSNVGALLHLDKLPISKELGSSIPELQQALTYACTGGDDYELLFTIAEEHRVSMESAMASYNLPVTCIGQITGVSGKIDLRLNDQPFSFVSLEDRGYQHF
ncbi:thiamine-phosphate kinase [Glaciecola siphonariae]|uniref:Thiamine-monophosphate kinase n=1 Tax=Glaciecola siphonariae TaxID=521012 RepID=A0ABV9M030_9ALTE